MDILKEIDKKADVIQSIRPFEGIYLKQLNDFFKIETTYTSNAVEGNSMSISETKIILEDGITVGGKPLRDFYEVVGHGRAYDYMFSLINNKNISEKNILYCHDLFSKGIEGFINPGKYRKSEIMVTGSKKVFPKPAVVASKMKEYIDWTVSERKKYHPVIFAAEAHRRLANIHPFTDGNGRISRLVMNTYLFQDRLLPVSIPVLRKSDYYNSLEKNNSKEFGQYIAGLELQTLNDLMRHLHIPDAKINNSIK
jgi:Fic family protein